MLPRVNAVKHLKDYELQISFINGTVATLDLRDRIFSRGGVFKPLQSIDYFKQVSVDRDAGTVIWPNGVDFCPDVLYAAATGTPIAIQAAESHA